MSKRVLIAGLFHETHTFLDGQTSLDEFRVLRGAQLLDVRGDGSPLAGVIGVAEETGWELLPAVDLRATPSATVADHVLECFWNEFRAVAERELSGGIDGICLVLHGAMATETCADVEGEILTRIRRLPGTESVPITGVLDLHGNISARFAQLADGFVAYRNNPHTDAHEAAIDGAKLLERIMAEGRRATCVWEQPPVMWPPTGTGTDDEPMRSLEKMAREIESAHAEIAHVNVFGGFSFADTPHTGVAFTAITFGDPEKARAQLARLNEWAIAHREAGNIVEPPLVEILPRVIDDVRAGRTPVVLVEPSDNVGGGAPGDGTSVLRALVQHGIEGSAVVINDPQAVERLFALEPGARLRTKIGGKGSRLAEGPLTLEVEVVSKSDGRFELEDRQSHLASSSGIHIDMGPSVVVRHAGIRILLTTRKTPPFDLGQLRSQGIEPERLSVIGVKAAVAHRRAYDKIVAASFTIGTPGPCAGDLTRFPWKNVRRPIFPLDRP